MFLLNDFDHFKYITMKFKGAKWDLPLYMTNRPREMRTIKFCSFGEQHWSPFCSISTSYT